MYQFLCESSFRGSHSVLSVGLHGCPQTPNLPCTPPAEATAWRRAPGPKLPATAMHMSGTGALAVAERHQLRSDRGSYSMASSQQHPVRRVMYWPRSPAGGMPQGPRGNAGSGRLGACSGRGMPSAGGSRPGWPHRLGACPDSGHAPGRQPFHVSLSNQPLVKPCTVYATRSSMVWITIPSLSSVAT